MFPWPDPLRRSASAIGLHADTDIVFAPVEEGVAIASEQRGPANGAGGHGYVGRLAGQQGRRVRNAARPDDGQQDDDDGTHAGQASG